MTRRFRKLSLLIPVFCLFALYTPLVGAVANPSSPCSISSNFNGTPIGGGNYIWFNSVVKVQGLDTSKGPVTVTFQGSTIQFTANGTPQMLVVPSARITFDPTATSAITTFTGGLWVTNVPASGLAGNVFLNALAFQVPASGFPGGIQPVTWQGTFSSAASGLKIQWQWGAAVYTSFSTDYNSLGVKPVDDNKASVYQNSDHAGTPENFKSFVIGGATGGGGSNWTGSYSGTGSCPTGLPATPQACSGQESIFIDPVHNIGYMPIYTRDGSGNAQLAVVDLTVGVVNPVLKTISLPGASRAFSTTFNPNNNTMLAEAETATSAVLVFEIDTATQSVKSVVPAPPLQGFFFGGILEDVLNNRAFVAGVNQIGILDTSKSPPVWDPTSVVPTVGTDSLSLNLITGILFISGDGNNEIIDTTKLPLNPTQFNSTFGITDGNAFDPATNILSLSQEVGADQTWAFNFATLNTGVIPATADNVRVPDVCPGGGTSCLGEAFPLGEGPGGETAISCTTHQAVVTDEYGQNLKLIQLPTASVPGALDNNGRPGSGIPADAGSVFTIAGTVIPNGVVNGTPAQLGILGDPNSLAVDPAHNFAYMLADANGGRGGVGTPLFLVRVDLSKPVPGASPTGGVNGTTFWTPASAAIRLP